MQLAEAVVEPDEGHPVVGLLEERLGRLIAADRLHFFGHLGEHGPEHAKRDSLAPRVSDGVREVTGRLEVRFRLGVPAEIGQRVAHAEMRVDLAFFVTELGETQVGGVVLALRRSQLAPRVANVSSTELRQGDSQREALLRCCRRRLFDQERDAILLSQIGERRRQTSGCENEASFLAGSLRACHSRLEQLDRALRGSGGLASSRQAEQRVDLEIGQAERPAPLE